MKVTKVGIWTAVGMVCYAAAVATAFAYSNEYTVAWAVSVITATVIWIPGFIMASWADDSDRKHEREMLELRAAHADELVAKGVYDGTLIHIVK